MKKRLQGHALAAQCFRILPEIAERWITVSQAQFMVKKANPNVKKFKAFFGFWYWRIHVLLPLAKQTYQICNFLVEKMPDRSISEVVRRMANPASRLREVAPRPDGQS
jgi:hypothetical protein